MIGSRNDGEETALHMIENTFGEMTSLDRQNEPQNEALLEEKMF